MRKTACLLLFAGVLALASCGERDMPETKTPQPTVHQDDDNNTGAISDSYVYTLPVIFHVLYKDASDPSQYVPASRLAELLANVNAIYRGNVYGYKGDFSQNVNVRFVLAETDESGRKLPVPGVEYVKWEGEYPIDCNDFMAKHPEYVKYIWEPNDYINVMMYNFKHSQGEADITLGITHMPYTVEGSNVLEGLSALKASQAQITKRNLSFPYCSSINSSYAWKDGNGAYYQTDRYTNADHGMFEKTVTLGQIASDVNVTLAHELGHYLGLTHVFAEHDSGEGTAPEDNCSDTDYCADTPSYNRVEYTTRIMSFLGGLDPGKNVHVEDLVARENCAGEDFYSANIMDYFYTFGYKISSDQRQRMRHVLYYSPLIPGPKKDRDASKTRAQMDSGVHGVLDLPIKTAK